MMIRLVEEAVPARKRGQVLGQAHLLQGGVREGLLGSQENLRSEQECCR